MNYTTVEVELENGHVRPAGDEALPAKARALLTLLDQPAPVPALTCIQLAERWATFDKLPASEATSFASDIEQIHGSLPSLKSAWD